MEVALVYLAAGLSKRFGGKIKQFAKVGPHGETLIEYSMNQALPAGFTKIIFVVGDKTEMVFKEKFGNNYKGIPVLYARQEFDSSKRNRPWGTADALCTIKGVVDCPFVMCGSDDIYGADAFVKLVEHFRTEKGDATVGYRIGVGLSDEGSVNRGVIRVDDYGFVLSIDETFNITRENLAEKGITEDTLASMCFYGITLESLDLINERLIEFKEKHEGDKEIECLHSTEHGKLIREGKVTMKVYSTTGKWYGVTNPGDEVKVREALAAERKV